LRAGTDKIVDMTSADKAGEPSTATAAVAPAPSGDLATTLPQATSIEPQTTEALLPVDVAPTEGPLASAQQINPVIAAQVSLPYKHTFTCTHTWPLMHLRLRDKHGTKT
jgi:hypothetical protein